MNLFYDLINEFGSGNVYVDREEWLLKVTNADLMDILNFVDFDIYDTIKMVVVDRDSVLIYCNPEFK